MVHYRLAGAGERRVVDVRAATDVRGHSSLRGPGHLRMWLLDLGRKRGHLACNLLLRRRPYSSLWLDANVGIYMG